MAKPSHPVTSTNSQDAVAKQEVTSPSPSATSTPSSNGSLPSLAANICPESIFTENGQSRGDYQGKPYLISAESLTWINANCSGKTSGISAAATPATESTPPLKLKSIGFNLDTYNESTGMAGDMKFTKIALPFSQIMSPFGQQDPRTTDTTKKNPQPTFILPLGTKVHALVDGMVVEVKEIYSGDSTIWVAKSKDSQWFYETEHVMNPLVKVGDTVKAGQVIADVSNYDSKNNPGFGLVEIGIMHSTSNGQPEHVCPFQYLDDSVKADINAKISALYTAWEKYLGKDVYTQEKFVSPGCAVEEGVAG
jgi:biotin carboxyl carrier protein